MARRLEFPHKPWDEPFREFSLESCEHCDSYIALTARTCTRCGCPRDSYDQNMADTVQAWRTSVLGQASWRSYFQHAEQLNRDRERTERIAMIFLAAVAFVPAFAVFGFIGMLMDMGLLFGLAGGTMTSWLLLSGGRADP